MPQPMRPFLGESAESRVQARRQLLLDQSLAWLADGQWRQVSIAQLCREVNLNKRYFYESFPDLDAVEDAVVEDLTSTLMTLGWQAAGEGQQQGMDTHALARHVLTACLGWLADDARRAYVLFAKAGGNPRARDQRSQVIHQLAQTLASFGLSYHQPGEREIPPDETHQHLASLGASMLIGGTIESILRWLEGELPLSLEAFVEYTAQFWVVLGEAAVALARRETRP